MDEDYITMTFEVKAKILICSILVAIVIVLGLMSYAMKSTNSDLNPVDNLFDRVEDEINWRKL